MTTLRQPWWLRTLWATAASLCALAAQAQTAAETPAAAREALPNAPAVAVNPAFASRAERMKLIAESRKNRKPKFDRTVGVFQGWEAARQRTEAMEARFDEPQGALTHFLSKRLPAGQTALGPDNYRSALEQVARMPVYSTPAGRPLPAEPATKSGSTRDGIAGSGSALAGNWQALGPGNIGGRTRALLIHPTTPTTLWAGGVAGGVWKSVDGGASWQPKADLLVNIAVNSMVLDPRNPNVLYAGTGEGFFNGDAVRGAGVLKSTDGGETWSQLPATANSDFFYVQKLVMSRGSSQRLYAATRTGIFRSTNGGASWSKVLDATAVNGCMDLAIQTDRALANVFAACGTFAQGTVYRALDTAGAQPWTPVLSTSGMGRTTLAIAPSNQNILYALATSTVAGTYNNGLLAVYRSTTGGGAGSWNVRVDNTSPNKLNTLLLSNPVIAFLTECGFGTSQFFNQGWYDNTIAVDPTDPDIVWAGGVDLFRSNDGGANWGQASHWWFTPGTDPDYNHADHHTIVFHPQYNGTTNKIMYTGNDGGIHVTDDARAPVSASPNPVTPTSPVCGNTPAGVLSWTNKNNGYAITQFYFGAVYPDGTTFFGGTQDNGTLRGTLAGGAQWNTIRGGDGGYVAVNPANTNMLWVENTGLSIQRSSDGGASWASVTSGITEPAGNFLFIAPFVQDPGNAARMYIGGARVWRAGNATAAVAPNPYWTQISQNTLSSRISALAVSPVNADRMYVGTGSGGGAANNGRVWTTNVATTATAATVWTSGKPRADDNYLSWIAPDPVTVGTVYATVATFNSPTGTGHVFKSTDFGATWASIDGSGATGLPDVPVHCIVVDPLNTQRLYVGSDLGVFVSLDGGANWARENTGFANVVVESMSIVNVGGTRYVVAFSHGRSVFRAQIS